MLGATNRGSQDLLLGLIRAERAFFKAVDRFFRPPGSGPEIATRIVEQGLVAETLGLMDALEAADEPARHSWEPAARVVVTAFGRLATELIESWDWGWASG